MTKPKRRTQRRTSKINPLGARIGRAVGADGALPPPTPRPAPPKPPPSSPPAEVRSQVDDSSLRAPLPPTTPPAPPPAGVDTHGTPSDLAGVSPIVSAGGADVSSRYAADSTYSMRLKLRGSVVARYASHAAISGCDVEESMERRLARYADATSDAPLTFTDSQRAAILDALGTADPESIVRHIRNLVSAAVIDTAGAPVSTLQFSAQQLERVASRCAHGESLPAKLQEYADYGINLQTGLA